MRDSHSFDVSKYGNGPITFEHRRSLVDDDFLGDRMPERLGNGPVEHRRRTDMLCMVICCVFFLAFIVLTFVYSFINKYDILLHPLDSDARTCGLDSVVKDYPYLYIFKFEKNYRSVCVKSCLRFDYNQVKYNADGTNTTGSRPLYFENFTKVVGRSAVYGASTGPRNSNYDYDADFAAGYFTKEQFDAYRQRQVLDCVPNTDVTSCKMDAANGVQYYDSRPYQLNVCFPLSSKIMKNLNFFGDLSAGAMTDIEAATWMIFLSMLVALILGLLMLYLSSFFIDVLIWVQIGLFVLVALFFGIMCWVVAFKDMSGALEKKNFKPEYVKMAVELNNSKWKMCIAGTVLILLAIVVLLVSITNAKSIKQAAKILKYSTTVLLKNVQLIFLALICFVLQIVVLFTCIWIHIGIYTSGEQLKDSTAGEPIAQFRVGFWRWLLFVLNIIAGYWILCYINNFCDFVSAGTTVNFYFNKKNRFFGAIGDALIYHQGSISLASLVLAPVTVLQLCFGWLFDLMTATGLEGEPNAVQKVLGKVCICFLYPYKKFILRLNEASFGMVYMSSADFCPSSKETYYLYISYANRIGNIDLVSNLYKFVVVLTIAILNAALFFWFFTFFKVFIRTINNPLIPALLIFLVSALITVLFLNIYTTIAQTAVLCYLIQQDVGKTPTQPELNAAMMAAEDIAAKGTNRYDPLK